VSGTRIDDLGYPIVVAWDALPLVRDVAKERGFARAVVLCDANVASRAQALAHALRAEPVMPFALGERRKTMRTLERVLDALSGAQADRETVVFGVGGGVAGDLFGFAAASYMRGVRFVNVATSLVAMADAAVGGKTGVDLRAGKNLAGAFRDPVAVFCDVGSLHTLSERQIREGLAEVVKHAVIEGGQTFESLETLAPHPLRKWPWESVVADSVRVKAMFVGDDRLERGARETLNLGHTFAHALETVSGYRVSHGAAVAIGLRAAGLLALRTGRFSAREHLRVLSLLALLRLPLVSPVVDGEALLAAMRFDKKARGTNLRFVLPRAIGDVEYGVVVASGAVRAVLRQIARPPGDDEVPRGARP
jgi:3-dehydroquinate synthase